MIINGKMQHSWLEIKNVYSPLMCLVGQRVSQVAFYGAAVIMGLDKKGTHIACCLISPRKQMLCVHVFNGYRICES